MYARQKVPVEFLPDRVGAWKQSGPDKHFDSGNLYDHIDGGAELFISYNFKEAVSRTYKKGGEAEITVDIFDMNQPKNAFGVFTHSRETVDHTVGQDCQIYQDAIIFWKNRYYVAITCFKCPDDIQSTILSMANYISRAIGAGGSLPAIISRLPKKGLYEESILYFNHYAWQNAFYYFGDENYFNIDSDTDAVLARYDQAGEPLYLMLIQYPDEQKAEAGLEKFENDYLENTTGKILRLEDGFWLGNTRVGAYFIVVFHAKSEDEVAGLLNLVKNKLK